MSITEKVKLAYLDGKQWFDNLSDFQKIQFMGVAIITISSVMNMTVTTLSNVSVNRAKRRSLMVWRGG